MNITIIRTSSVIPKGHITSMSAVPDIGTAYITAYLKKENHNVRLIDSQGEGIDQIMSLNNSSLLIHGLTSDQIVKRISRETQIILVSCMHSNRWIYDSKIIKKINIHFPDVKVIVGGEHATACANDVLLSDNDIYAVVRGEGEVTLSEIIHNIENENYNLSTVDGVSFLNEKNVTHNKDRARIVDLDSLPFPDWSQSPIENYLSRHYGVNSMHYRSLPVITSRGCPFKCKFCSNNTMWNSKWYGRSVESVVLEIKILKEKYQINHIDLIDLTLSLDLDWQERFARVLLKEKINIMWSLPIGTRTEGLTSELLKKLKKSGLQRVLYASETGSSKTAESIGKEICLSNFYKVLKWTSANKIVVKITLILGFPGQTKRELLESFKLILRAAAYGVNDIVCLCFVPYPNTVFYKDLKVDYDYDSADNNININNDIKDMKSWSEHYSDNILKIGVVFFTLFFYFIQFILRPWRAVIALYRIFIEKLPLTNFESIVYNIFKRKKDYVGSVDD